MDHFLSSLYPYYDIAIWSQTNWRWLELKVTELGMMSNSKFKICFVLDKSNMFKVSFISFFFPKIEKKNKRIN